MCCEIFLSRYLRQGTRAGLDASSPTRIRNSEIPLGSIWMIYGSTISQRYLFSISVSSDGSTSCEYDFPLRSSNCLMFSATSSLASLNRAFLTFLTSSKGWSKIDLMVHFELSQILCVPSLSLSNSFLILFLASSSQYLVIVGLSGFSYTSAGVFIVSALLSDSSSSDSSSGIIEEDLCDDLTSSVYFETTVLGYTISFYSLC